MKVIDRFTWTRGEEPPEALRGSPLLAAQGPYVHSFLSNFYPARNAEVADDYEGTIIVVAAVRRLRRAGPAIRPAQA